MSKVNLQKAKSTKNDEYYTRLEDIEPELKHYFQHFKDKIIYCNCDNPAWSQFFTYFISNRTRLGIKEAIFTFLPDDKEQAYSLSITSEGTQKTILNGDKQYRAGDFRSSDCLRILDRCDIVITNPPFSLFREYLALMMEHNKKFIILGSNNAITYRDTFPLLMDNRIWLGYTTPNRFTIPKKQQTGAVTTFWYTNLGEPKRNPPLKLTKHYSPYLYPKYDNYDAINVNNINDIPCDYYPEVIEVNSEEELNALKKKLDSEHRYYTVEEIPDDKV